ncbi:MAG: type II toxin-antitoxin system PemK/MazF family toxin [Chitinophagaceae bacterium]|nr:type II toxin-antitoxin system PemK/MazF family toxin [Chitinophagaceae bacterium]
MALSNYRKWQVVLVNLNPVKGKEISKIRPCLIVSPNAANRHLQTVIVAPLTSTIKNIPTRLQTNFGNTTGEICFDQIRAVDKHRIIKVLGTLDAIERKAVNQLLQNMFSEQ